MESEEVHKDLKAAEDAMNQCRYDVALRQLDLAAHAGAEPRHISDMGRKIRAAKAFHDRKVRGSVRLGFFIALVGYLILMMRQPIGWTTPVWITLGFVVIPCVAGLFVGRRHAGEQSAARAFSDGARSGLFAMMCYSAVNIVMLLDKLQKDSTQVGDEYFAAIIAVAAYSLAAGAVSGLASAAISRIGPKLKGNAA